MDIIFKRLYAYLCFTYRGSIFPQGNPPLILQHGLNPMKLDSREKSFNLLAWFSILSFVCIALISIVSSFLLSRFLTENMLQRDAVITKEFADGLIGATDASLYFEGTETEHAKTGFEDLFKRIALMPDVVRVNIYDKQGTVLWSDDARFIDHNFMPNAELIRALSGAIAISSGTSGKPIKGEHVFDKEVPFFVETYIPIWNKKRDKVFGAFEVYKEPISLFNAIKKGEQLIWTTAVLGGIFLYASLFWIVKRATFIIRQQQDQLIESETMAAIGEMSSAVAHGIRNPLATIRSSAELSLEGDPSPFFRSTAQEIILEVDRLTGWIKELLAYAQVSGESLSYIQINDLLRSTLAGFGQKLKKGEIKVNLHFEAPMPKIKADEISMRHIFISLITNAIEAMPQGGELRVSSRFIKNEGVIEIKIADTGKGIAKDQIDKVFIPFFTTKRQGVGVGLPLVKRIIGRYNGSIRLDSQEGQGATVSIQIPIAK